MSKKSRLGKRRHRANIEQHNGAVDAHGQPSTAASAWNILVREWPCEIRTTKAHEDPTGGGTIMGYEVYGPFITDTTVAPNMRMIIDGITYEVVAASDESGMRRELKIDAKREIYG